MDKLQIAHEMALIMAQDNRIPNSMIVDQSWIYADAMQAEADKRKQQKLDEVRKGLKEGWFTEKEGEHFKEVSEALRQPLVSDEWQPDWSVAPSWAKWFVMEHTGRHFWLQVKPVRERDYWLHKNREAKFDECGDFGYVGSWQDSLRKRP